MPPYFTNEKKMQSYQIIPSGRAETLVCAVDGVPFPRVKWYKNGQEFKSRSTGEHVISLF